MKRVGHIYEKICTYENISKAIDKAVLGKRKTKECMRIINNKDYYIRQIQNMLITQTYPMSQNRYKTIVSKTGKERHLIIPKFYPDRIIHWALCLQLEQLFMKGMYKHSIGSIPGRGGLMGKKYIERIINKDKKAKYILKLDIKHFYPSVSHSKLKELFRTKIKDEKTLTLIYRIIDNGEEGLPIGYYTSQWFSNFYLEKLDHFIKEQLHIKYYVRYVDDMVLIDTNKRKLRKAKLAIDEFLLTGNYNLEIKENYQLWKIHTRPLDFLGYRFYKDKTLLRKSIFYGFNRRLRKIKKRGYCTIARARALASLLGWFKHISSGRDYYVNNIKPIISKRRISTIISIYDRKVMVNTS